MKRNIILSFILIFSLIGCTNSSVNENVNNNYVSNTISYTVVEKQIATFSTKILNTDSARQTNIELACSKLNGTIVKSGELFSFCNLLGPATPEGGYEKADSFDSEGNVYKEYGGGKCQVSSTLYNAVLLVPSLTVVERHPHSGQVDYVEEGKDAAVAYGSVDFKFKNDTNYDIRIEAYTDSKKVIINLISIMQNKYMLKTYSKKF